MWGLSAISMAAGLKPQQRLLSPAEAGAEGGVGPSLGQIPEGTLEAGSARQLSSRNLSKVHHSLVLSPGLNEQQWLSELHSSQPQPNLHPTVFILTSYQLEQDCYFRVKAAQG